MLYLHRHSVDGELDSMSHAIVEAFSHPVSQQVKNKLTVKALLPEVVKDQLYDSTNFGVNHRLISNKVLCSTYIRGDILCLKIV